MCRVLKCGIIPLPNSPAVANPTVSVCVETKQEVNRWGAVNANRIYDEITHIDDRIGKEASGIP